MSFSIDFIDEMVPDELAQLDEKASFANIEIGNFSERMLVPLDYWDTQDYINQWLKEIIRFVDKQRDTAVLVVEMYDPEYANFIKCWTLYREAGHISVYNNMIFMDEIEKPFSIEKIHSYVPTEPTRYTDDGEEISVWSTTEDEIKDWHDKLKYQHED